MTEVGWSQWAVVIFFFGIMCVYAFSLARALFQVLLRLSKKTDRSLYRKWGVEQDLFWPCPKILFMGWCILLVFGATFSFAVALSSTLLLTDASRVGGDQFYSTFTFFFLGFILGAAIESQRFEDVRRKIKRLEGLREAFHDRFSVSELLSVYESLQHSPPIFWEEYAQIPDEEINEETNRKFRERAVPYRYSQSSKHNRILMIVAVLTLLVGAMLAGRDFLL